MHVNEYDVQSLWLFGVFGCNGTKKLLLFQEIIVGQDTFLAFLWCFAFGVFPEVSLANIL
jgi:hypothetical protein